MQKFFFTIRHLALSVLIISMLLMGSSSAFADSAVEEEAIIQEPAAQVDCFNGKEQFRSFLQSFISFDQFDFFVKDMFMNACQYTSVKRVKDDLEDLREDIRDAYYRCDSNQETKLRLEYYRREAELFFLRNIVTTKDNTRVAHDLNNLREKMFERFVEKRGYFLEQPDEGSQKELFIDVWSDFVERHDPAYFIECKGDVELIQESIDNVRDTIEGIAQEFRNTQGEIAELTGSDDDQESSATGNKSASESQLKLNAMNITAHMVNNVTPQKVGRDIIRQLGPRPITQFELTQRLAHEERRFRMDLKRAEKLGRYKAEYQYTADPISTDYTERIDLIIGSLELAQMDSVDVTSCLEFVNETQCSE